MKRLIGVFLLAGLGGIGGLMGQSAPKYSNEFLRLGVGARAMAMGNSMQGIVGDVTAGYWNPAGLCSAPMGPQLALMHSEYFAGIAKYDYGGFTLPVDERRRFGVSLIRLGIDDIANTLNLIDVNGNIDYDAVSSFSVSDMAVILSMAQKIEKVEGLNLGANFKVINRNVGKFATAWGFGLDVGAQYQRNGLKLGLTLADVTGTFNAWTFNTETFQDAFIATGNEIPENSLEITLPSARMGAGYTFFQDKKVEMTGAVDLTVHADGKRNVLVNAGPVSFDPHAGLELGYQKKFFLRGGFYNLQRVPNAKGNEAWSVFPTVGAGLNIKNLGVDYALTNVGNFSQTLYSHVFSLQYTFKPTK